MKKFKIVFLILVLMFVLVCSGCNKQIFDTVYQYKYAIIHLPNGEIVEGKVENWNDYQDSDQLQIKIDGIYYLVHSTDCVLMTEKS